MQVGGGCRSVGNGSLKAPLNTLAHGEMELILIIVVVLLLFAGGGFWGRRRGHW
jgi:hypothetical protein